MTVEVDRAALLAEADAIAAQAPAATLDPGQGAAQVPTLASAPDPASRLGETAPAVRLLVRTLSDTFAPNWAVTAQESDRVGDALAAVMVYWLPAGAIEPKYLALVTLAGAVYGVAAARRDADSGEWRPLRAPPAPPAAAPTPDPQMHFRL